MATTPSIEGKLTSDGAFGAPVVDAASPSSAGLSRAATKAPALFRWGWKIALVAGAACLAGAGGVIAQSTPSSTVTATQSNPGNGFHTGTLLVNGSPASGSSLFSITSAQPGDDDTATYNLTNVGSLPATITLSITGVSSGALAGRLTLEVTDPDSGTDVPGLTGTATLSADGTTTNFTIPGWNGAAATSQWAPGETHALLFSVRFPSHGPGQDDSLQNTSASFSVSFTGTQ